MPAGFGAGKAGEQQPRTVSWNTAMLFCVFPGTAASSFLCRLSVLSSAKVCLCCVFRGEMDIYLWVMVALCGVGCDLG